MNNQSITKQQENQIQKASLSTSVKIYKTLDKVKIQGQLITSRTGHGLVITGKQISDLCNDGDNRDALLLLGLFVAEIFEWHGKEISGKQTTDVAKMIYRQFYWLRLIELKLFTEKLKSGHWKQVHGMSPVVLMERLTEFANESMDTREVLADSLEPRKEQGERQYDLERGTHKMATLLNKFNNDMKK